MNKIESSRNFMKSISLMEVQDGTTDQARQLPQPPLQKPYDASAEIIALPEFDDAIIKKKSIYDCFKDRKSVRKYSESSLSLPELSFLLWATQGIKEIRGNNYATVRPVPSGGARHPFETTIYVNRVDRLRKGLYRYLALSHELLFLHEVVDAEKTVEDSVLGQKWAAQSAVVFYWSCVPYRGEWRYSTGSHKTMLLDAGHLGQNLYLACEAIGCGTCAIASYDQHLADKLLGIDGNEEYTVYISPVGKVLE